MISFKTILDYFVTANNLHSIFFLFLVEIVLSHLKKKKELLEL